VIDVEIIETKSLGDHSYLVTDGEVAVVVDPQRDVDRVLALLEDRGLRLTHVLETHLHNDYVSGGLDLVRRTGATYVLPADDEVVFERTGVRDGDVLETGGLRLRALHTPGHTHHHHSYVLEGTGDEGVVGVFTGGSMLYGATGRTDLLGEEHTDALTRKQYHSVRRLATELPGDAQVYPTHGFGSFCSATPPSGDSSTVGEQKSSNPALTLEEQEYVDQLLAGLDAYPAYYAHMGPLNASGPQPWEPAAPATVEPDGLRRRIEAGEWVVDLRDRTAFAAGHVRGTYGFELSDNFVTYVGWLMPWGSPLTLLGESADQVATAQRELARIGIDRPAGAAVGDPEDLAGDEGPRSYRVADFAQLAKEQEQRDVQVLDARRNDERAQGYVAGSQHIPIHEVPGRLDEVPDGEVWVYCGSGYRASIAASMLDRPGRDVVLINEEYGAAADSGVRTTEPGEDGDRGQ
jgi:glyoxylase-like metal-dependent hydrolase (beta-lactamase superfamily II)/rhodanese-related sulfurtransferase